MIIFSIIFAIMVGNICISPTNFSDKVDNLTIFYIALVGLFILCKVYFFTKPRLSLQIISSSAKKYKTASIVIAFICTIFGVVTFFTSPQTAELPLVSLIHSVGIFASGLSLLALTTLSCKGAFRNQLASSIGTVPVLWLVFEIILIFKNQLSNPHMSEYILPITMFACTAMAIYHFTTAFCVVNNFNSFKEYYILSIFVCVTFLYATLNGLVSTSDIDPVTAIGSCFIFNAFMLPYYIVPNQKELSKIPEVIEDKSTTEESEPFLKTVKKTKIKFIEKKPKTPKNIDKTDD